MKEEGKVIEGRKLLAIVMTLALLFSMLPTGGAKADSEPNTKDVYYSVGSDTTYPGGWYSIDSSNPVLWGTGNNFWYVLTDTTEITGSVTISGNVNLMLANESGVVIKDGLVFKDNAKLNIYSGTSDPAKRSSSGSHELGIYRSSEDTAAVSGKGSLIVKSGVVTMGNDKAYAIANDTYVSADKADYFAGTDRDHMTSVTSIQKNQKFVRIDAKGYRNTDSNPSAPSTPAQESAAPEESAAPSAELKIETTVENGNAKVSEITAETIAASAGTGQAGTEAVKVLTITAAKQGETVTSVELSKTSVKALEEALESTATTYEKVVIEMTDVSVEVDAGTLAALVNQAKDGESVKLEVNDTSQTGLKTEQQTALTKWAQEGTATREVAKVIKASFVCGSTEIHSFNGGKVTVSVKFQPAAGKDARHYHVYYVAENGEMTRQTTSYKDGKLLFDTDHFSEYAIVYDAALENETGKTAATPTPTAAPVATATPAPTAAPTAAPVATATPVPTEDTTGTPEATTIPAVKEVSANVSLISGLKVTQSGKKLTCKWGKVSSATKYVVSAQYTSGKKSATKATVKKSKNSYTFTKLAKKALDTKKVFKVTVTAYKGSKKLGTVTAFVAGSKNTTYSNAKSLTVKNVTVKKGKTAKISASVTLSNKKKKSVTNVKKLRYVSSDKTIATVNASGKVKGKKKGTCTIYVYAANGCTKKVKVTVK